ncbi:ABC transporter ATP-binding protein [Brenneria goodwinii]|uniref:ABC transporter ATP-binding protein n=1 Tax=Brenneria goodwinii TaxID=1109412 RepID=UPI000EF22FC5|nr:ABC transporter ATP-binding protein [Brenneria goodwinii]MCG8158281.1 ABC transporter ATP-binding protein [Brenneria goodwinii]MCG8162369.1 ABC transporter ATP-binding protein [Brenneria goodwinii]MCG8167331.1 ABC transporter ATP-binding protein [Brenneria goodwinii]MCG8172001.1 ABC transporter ATP-binding protein [Brenneria goodwinii]MCG8175592.1 ABC transporter ATP-binding protein [Brenneria goodwinii]
MSLQFTHISKFFTVNGQTLPALQEINLALAPGELMAIIGASGCGKSTLLRLAAGLERAEQGQITVNGRPLNGIPPRVSLVFQEARLFPWLTVADNIALGMEQQNLSPQETARRVAHYLAMMGLEGFAQAWPHQLSGGMAQRVAIARGLAAQPTILLLDEPFGALDALTRQQLQDSLAAIRRQTNLSILLVTHDVEEALFLADRIVVMSPRPGRIRHILPVELPWPRERTGQPLQQQRQLLCNMLEQSGAPVA